MELKKRYIKALVDAETGEITYPKKERKVSKSTVPFMFLFETIEILYPKLQSRLDFIMLIELAFRVNPGGRNAVLVLADRQKIADKLGIYLTQISRTLTRLEEVGVIERVRRNEYRIKTTSLWKGSFRDWKKHYKEHDPLKEFNPYKDHKDLNNIFNEDINAPGTKS